jgi:hypothetical protein
VAETSEQMHVVGHDHEEPDYHKKIGGTLAEGRELLMDVRVGEGAHAILSA